MKPDDLSQDAWDAAVAAQDAAIECCKAERLAYPFPTCNGKAVLDEAIARAITAAVAAEREATLDAASAYLQEQYGYGMLSHPVDRARIHAIRERGQPC